MSGERPCEVCQSITDGTYSPGDDCLGDPGCCEQPRPAERVQRELAEALPFDMMQGFHTTWQSPPRDYRMRAAAALLPTVQALIAAELRGVADNVRKQAPGYIGRIDTADSIDDRADALDTP